MSTDTPDNNEANDNIEAKKPRRAPARAPRKKKAAVVDEPGQESLPQAELTASTPTEPAPIEAKPARRPAARRPVASWR